MRDAIQTTKKINRILIGMFILVIGFLWGVLTATNKIFPFEQIAYLERALLPVSQPQTKEPKPRNSIFQAFNPQVSVVMIGDSLTEAAEWHDIFPDIKIANRGIGGDRANDILLRMEPILNLNASKAFLMFGINDVYSGQSIDAILNNYTSITRQLQNKGIEVYIQATLECSRSICEEKLLKVRELNKKLETYAKENHIAFININNGLTSQEEGLLKKYTYDGIHLLGSGYLVWGKAISPYVIKK